MNLFENYKKNVINLDLKESSYLGLHYFAGCLGAVNSWMKKDDTLIKSLKINTSLSEKASLADSSGRTLASYLLIELFYCAYSKDNTIRVPSDDKSYDFIHLEDGSRYKENELNEYLSFSINDLEYCKFQRFNLLIWNLGYEINMKDIETPDQAFQLGIEHFNYWFGSYFTTNFETFFTSVIRCNLLPTVFADVINSLPYPEKMQSKSEFWIFSKELDNRIKDVRFELDLITMQWIWAFHNFLFYEQGKGPNIIREKYQKRKGFQFMLSDIFKNIEKFEKRHPLKSSNFKFRNCFNKDSDWEKFCVVSNDIANVDFGTNKVIEFDSHGEFLSYYSFLFTNGILQYVVPKKRFLFFKY